MTTIRFGDKVVNAHDLKNFKPDNYTQDRVKRIVIQWLNEEEYFHFNTSGSTGTPKEIILNRNQLEKSARSTIEALKLAENDTACLCINPDFIGGTMMVVRALLNNMHLVVIEAQSNPLKLLKVKVDFIALVPLQLHETLNNEQSRGTLLNIKKVIIGGGSISAESIHSIQNFTNEFYATYGMTETVSHVALKKLNGTDKSDFYHTLPKIKIKQDHRDCLVINAPCTNYDDVITNDQVEILDESTFEWLGRFDNIINTGGIKLNSEKLEAEIQKIMDEMKISHSFFIGSKPDDKLGEKVILYLEGEIQPEPLLTTLKKELPTYHCPKEIIQIDSFIYSNNKLNRELTKKRHHSN